MPSSLPIKIVLAGNPNSGKSSLFNLLTGLRQKVGNFPGVTVDRKSGNFSLDDGTPVELTDLPGTYSLYPNSEDERVVMNLILDRQNPSFPDLVLYVADSTNFEKSLVFLTQILDLGIPAILLLNMADLADRSGVVIDSQALEEALGIPVVRMNSRTGDGIKELKKAIMARPGPGLTGTYRIPSEALPAIDTVKTNLGEDIGQYHALAVAHQHSYIYNKSQLGKDRLAVNLESIHFDSLDLQFREMMERHNFIDPLVRRTVKLPGTTGHPAFTTKLDKILTHPILGMLIFVALLFLVFQAIFAWATYPMDLIDSGFAGLTGALNEGLPDAWYTRLLTDGILAGLGGILIFVPQIAILFGLLSLLDEIGYMPRAIYLTDNFMRRFGLNGRSIVALLSGAACAIPAIMSTRTISDWKERLITIMVTPLISCSARIPVFAVLVAFVVPREASWGPFNMQGIVVMCLYTAGVLAALGASYIFKLVLKSGEAGSLMLELPSYKWPVWKNVLITMFEKCRIFVVDAGKIIIVIAIILWFLSSYGPPQERQTAVAKVYESFEAGEFAEEELENRLAAVKLEYSYAGHLGRYIEPVIAPLGFDWKIGISLITSFAAREVFVASMSTIYSIGTEGEEQRLIERLRQIRHTSSGKLYFTPALALSLLVFYLFAMQCMSTLAVVRRETRSWKWPIVQFAYMTALAYVSSLIVYQSAVALGY